MCKTIKVSRSGYYKYRCRKPSKAEQKCKCIAMYARVFHKHPRGIYGYRKVFEDFRREVTGMHCSRETLRRVKSANHLFSCVKSHHRYHCIERDKVYKCPDNILSRDFSSPEKNRKRVGDITYIWTKEGWLYLAAVMDLYSRKVIG